MIASFKALITLPMKSESLLVRAFISPDAVRKRMKKFGFIVFHQKIPNATRQQPINSVIKFRFNRLIRAPKPTSITGPFRDGISEKAAIEVTPFIAYVWPPTTNRALVTRIFPSCKRVCSGVDRPDGWTTLDLPLDVAPQCEQNGPDSWFPQFEQNGIVRTNQTLKTQFSSKRINSNDPLYKRDSQARGPGQRLEFLDARMEIPQIVPLHVA